MAQVHSEITVNENGVELGANGVPYYKWPPFPTPPDGVTIIPFNDFKPSGIQIPFDDEVEVDGLGIPTVRLAITHDNEGLPKKKRKTKKGNTDDEVRRRNVWWEEWEEGEAQRIRSAKIYDQMFHPKARVSRAVEEFRRVHDWEPVSLRLLEWYNKFMYFLGLNDVNIRPRYHRKYEEEQQADEENSDDGASKPRKPAESQPIKIDQFDEEKHKLRQRPTVVDPDERFQQKLERIREAQECRIEAFIDNPHLATKIFFSSYFRDSGMMWENMALRDAPRIVEFFLNYLLGTHALYEEEASLRLAVEVARKAKEELPLTMKIGMNMPDELAKSLIATYGSQVKKISWLNESEQEDAETQFKAQVEEGGGVIISDIVPGPPPETASGGAATADETHLPQAEETTSGWGSFGGGAAGSWGGKSMTDEQPEADGWGDNPWAQTKTENVWAQPDEHSLVSLLGPNTLHITHTVGYVEESTRYVSSVEFPESNDKLANKDKENTTTTTTDLLRTNFARVVLKPYPSFAAPSAPRAAIQPPELIEDPWVGISSDESDLSIEKPRRVRVARHDPTTDSITMLIDPKVAKDLALSKRMGLGGTFVQIVQIVPNHPATVSGGYDGKASTVEDTFWYAEKILQIIPSFWTEKQT